MRARHDQVYGGSFIFQPQSVRPVFHSLEIFCGRGPAPIGVEEVLFHGAGEGVIGNLIFLKAPFIADAPAPVPEIKFARRTMADRAQVIFLAHRLHQRRQVHSWVNLTKQFLNRLLTLTVSALAKVSVTEITLLIEQVLCWPVAVGKRFEDLTVAVDYDRIREPEFADSPLHVRFVLREGELWCVHTDDCQSLVAVALVPRLHIRQRADAIDAGVIPKIDQYGTATQLAKAQRWRV